jgi:hypothetical protein
LGLNLGNEEIFFRHNLTCQKAEKPFRPARSLARAKISGSLTAWIDGAGSGDAPELDKHGRYKILLPLDVSGRGGGKASAWVRMAQPYVGRGYGQNFPLTPGIEVLLTFIDGNPDRPVISGAVANAETGNVINASSNLASTIGTKGGSGLLFAEKEGKQKVALSSGSNRGSISLSANSGTAALIRADVVNTTSTTGTAMSTFTSSYLSGETTKVGATHEDIQALNVIIKANAGVNALADIGDTLTTLITDVAGQDDSPGSPSDIATKSFSVFNSCTEDINKTYQYVETLRQLLRIPVFLKAHMNLFSLNVNPISSISKWNSKVSSSSKLISALSILGSLTTAAGNTMNAATNIEEDRKYDVLNKEKAIAEMQAAETKYIQDKAVQNTKENSYNDAQQAYERALKAAISAATLESLRVDRDNKKKDLDDHQFRKQYTKDKKEMDRLRALVKDLEDYEAGGSNVAFTKKAPGALAAGTSLDAAINNLISMYTTYKAMTGANTLDRKGVVLNNSDSYMSLQAKEHLALSAAGPVLIESQVAPMAELLTLGLYENQVPEQMLTPDILTGHDATCKSSNTVLIRTGFLRALADEINQQATKAILNKSEEVIQLIAGVNPYEPYPIDKQQKQASKELISTAQTALKLAKGGAAKSAARIALLNLYPTFQTADAAPIKHDSSFTKGILLKTQAASQPIRLVTGDSGSKVELFQGLTPAMQENATRQLSLTNTGTLLQDEPDVKLEFKSKAATLSTSTDILLKLDAQGATLQQSGGNNLAIKNSDATLKHSTKAVMDGGGSTVTLSASAVEIKGTGQASMSGSIIKIG